MKIIATFLPLFLWVVNAYNAAAASPAITLAAGFETPYTVNGVPVLFVGEEARVRLTVLCAESQHPTVQIHPSWLNEVEWFVKDSRGSTQRLAPSSIRLVMALHSGANATGKTVELKPNERLEATFTVSMTQVGEYSLSARTMWSGVPVQTSLQPYVVRKGDEDSRVEAIFLRSRAERIRRTPPECASLECRQRRWQEYKRFMIRLSELQPDAGVWEALGDVSLGNASPEETRGYYDRALKTAEAYLISKYGSLRALPRSVADYWARRQRELTLYARRVYPYILENPAVIIVPDNGMKRQKVFIAYEGQRRIVFADSETMNRQHRR